jgi:hypothetical protein
MIVMKKQDDIPCANCQSWIRKEKKFSCNPDSCKQLTVWLLEHKPQVDSGTIHMQVPLPEIASQYVV